MNYELAKELKEAGFPFNKSLFASINDNTPMDENGTPYNTPTLEELIEALPEEIKDVDGYFSLAMFDKYSYMASWRCPGSYEREDDKFRQDGSTPSEAVARLWLALNEK